MRTDGKHYRAGVGTIEPRKLYSPREAVERVKTAGYAKFDESVDVAVRLGVDPKHADQVVRGTVSLPNGTGKTVRVLVIAQGDKAKEAERSEEHTSELQSQSNLVCRLLLEKKKKTQDINEHLVRLQLTRPKRAREVQIQ